MNVSLEMSCKTPFISAINFVSSLALTMLDKYWYMYTSHILKMFKEVTSFNTLKLHMFGNIMSSDKRKYILNIFVDQIMCLHVSCILSLFLILISKLILFFYRDDNFLTFI